MARSGGGRSSGGSGSRSSGGRRSSGASRGGFSGGSRSSGGFGSSRSSGSFGSSRPSGSFGSSRPSGSFGGPRRPVGGFGSSPRPVGGGGGTGCMGCGCGTVAAVILVIAVVIIVLTAMMGGFGGGSGSSSSEKGSITVSTVKREALPAGSVDETAYYTDELGWILRPSKLESGMRNFYKRTGVQPHLYLTDTVDGTHRPSNDQVDTFVNSLYDTLFTDEGHILVLFFEYDGEYLMWYVNGRAADTVMDSEAVDILFDYIEKYYSSDLSDEEMFSRAFDEASERIMSVHVSPWVYVAAIAGVAAVAGIAFAWWRAAAKKRKERDEHTRRILETPLETFDDEDLKRRAEKYGETGGDDTSGE